MSFRAFTEQHVGAACFETPADDSKSRLFHASLQSTEALFRWTRNARNKRGEAFDLHLGYIDDRRPNAFADSWNGQHFIAMHSPLFACINEFAFFCFTQKDFFPDVGNPAAETSPPPWDERVPGIWLLDFTSQGGHVDDDHSRQLIPRDSDRYVMAIYLAQLMVRYTWLHELAHCFNGHVGYARKHGLGLRLYELADGLPALSVGKPRRSAQETEARHCLEFDADQSALGGLLASSGGSSKLSTGSPRLIRLFGCG